jgi:hypothetical protein
MPKVQFSPHRGRPVTKGEKRTAAIAFRTTATVKALAEHLARREGRSTASLIEQLIERAAAAGTTKSDPLAAG